jgi:hypothetical protein
MYEIEARKGRYLTLYKRNQFVICKETFLNVDNVSQKKIRYTARKLSNLDGIIQHL